MMNRIVMHSYAYLMNNTYERISSGKFYDLQLKPYKKVLIERMINYFEELEEYEKCKVLLDFSKERFNHEKNYVLV